MTQVNAPLRCGEIAALVDAGYQDVQARSENVGRTVKWHVVMKRSQGNALSQIKLGGMTEELEHLKANVRAKVEHPIYVIKKPAPHCKARYRGLAENTVRFSALFAFADLVLVGR